MLNIGKTTKMYLDPSRIADLKQLDQAQKTASTKERLVIQKTRENIMRMSQNEQLAKLREHTTNALIKGDKVAAEKLNKQSLELTQGQY